MEQWLLVQNGTWCLDTRKEAFYFLRYITTRIFLKQFVREESNVIL